MQPPEASDARPRRHAGRWWLLGLYVLAYGGFIGVTVLSPATLAVRMPGGVNLAVAWGMGLILLAVCVALASLRLPEDR